MFTLQELEDDATLLLDLKEDVRDECETMGDVTNVTLYDVRSTLHMALFRRSHVFRLQKEETGIITVRFKEDIAAQACISVRILPSATLRVADAITASHRK